MTARTTIDKAGRIVIPKQLRDELRVEPGDALELASGGGEITLRPVRPAAPLVKELGIWVYRAGTQVDAEAAQRAIDQVRDARLDDLTR